MNENHLSQPELEEAPGHLPAYEPPQIVTYRAADILAALGPVQACSFTHSVVLCGPEFDQALYGKP